jgi:hypothetical protein
VKMRVNRGQEFVIGAYTVDGARFDVLIFGYYESGKLIYAARTRQRVHSEVAPGSDEAVSASQDRRLSIR